MAAPDSPFNHQLKLYAACLAKPFDIRRPFILGFPGMYFSPFFRGIKIEKFLNINIHTNPLQCCRFSRLEIYEAIRLLRKEGEMPEDAEPLSIYRAVCIERERLIHLVKNARRGELAL